MSNAVTANLGALGCNLGRSDHTLGQDGSAIKLFNYFIVNSLNMVPLDDMNIEQLDDGVQSILTASFYWLRDTNISKNHGIYLAHPDCEPKGYLKHGVLKEYPSKAINLLRKLIPDSEFWEGDEYISDMSEKRHSKEDVRGDNWRSKILLVKNQRLDCISNQGTQ